MRTGNCRSRPMLKVEAPKGEDLADAGRAMGRGEAILGAAIDADGVDSASQCSRSEFNELVGFHTDRWLLPGSGQLRFRREMRVAVSSGRASRFKLRVGNVRPPTPSRVVRADSAVPKQKIAPVFNRHPKNCEDVHARKMH